MNVQRWYCKLFWKFKSTGQPVCHIQEIIEGLSFIYNDLESKTTQRKVKKKLRIIKKIKKARENSEKVK